MTTAAALELERSARLAALVPAAISGPALRAWVRELGFASFPRIAAWAPSGPELLEQEIAALRIIELTLWRGEHTYIPIELLDYVYVAVGDRQPRRDYRRQAAQRRLSWLAAEVYERLLASQAPATSSELRDRLGAERTSVLGIERALAELAATLKVLRVGRDAGSPLWRPLVSLLPGVPDAAESLSLLEAASALVSHRLGVTLCETEESLAAFFAPLFSRSRIRAALHGLEARHQVRLDSLDGRQAYRLTTPPAPLATS